MYILLYLLLCLTSAAQCLLDPVSLTVGAAAMGLLGWNFNTVKEHTYCRFNECCTEEYIKPNIEALRDELDNNLFGQHIVLGSVLSSLRMHYHKDASSKPLVISFHGTPGTGKNYVADFIAKSLYKNGLDSKYVHKFLGRLQFPEAHRAAEYGVELRDKITNAVAKCDRSLFIFDEVDKIPPGVFETITSLLDHHSVISGLNYRKSIFLFLSNAAGPEISHKLYTLSTKDGLFREETKLNDFEKICELGAYNMKGGLQNSAPIKAGLIDHYIPFLPLERRHVERCIKAEFLRLNINPSTVQVAEVLSTVSFDEVSQFANYGCKRLQKKVQLVAHKHDMSIT